MMLAIHTKRDVIHAHITLMYICFSCSFCLGTFVCLGIRRYGNASQCFRVNKKLRLYHSICFFLHYAVVGHKRIIFLSVYLEILNFCSR